MVGSYVGCTMEYSFQMQVPQYLQFARFCHIQLQLHRHEAGVGWTAAALHIHQRLYSTRLLAAAVCEN